MARPQTAKIKVLRALAHNAGLKRPKDLGVIQIAYRVEFSASFIRGVVADMLADELIAKESKPVRGAPPKYIYTITTAGRTELDGAK